MAIPIQHVFVDANVLYSRTLRDWLSLIALKGGVLPPYRVYWTDDVLAEVVYHLRREKPNLSGKYVSNISDRLAEVFEGGRVTEFVVDVEWKGADPHDAHVHAAARACGAHILLTQNTSDFPSDDDYEVFEPDAFFGVVDDSAPHLVRQATEDQMAYWCQLRGESRLPEFLEAAQCMNFAERVRRHQAAIGGTPYRPLGRE